MMSCVCLDLGYGGSKNNNRDFKSVSGIASVYDRSSGKQTASGEQLDEDALTAAHRSLPLASMTAKDRNVSGWSYRYCSPALCLPWADIITANCMSFDIADAPLGVNLR